MNVQPIVTVKQGKLQGILQKKVFGSYYYCFKGIPYAAPPINELRFKDPEPPASWEGIRDSSKNAGEVSAQFDLATKKVIGGEDCLYLNVYVRSVPYDLYQEAVRNPVMIWIHPGNYDHGTGNNFQLSDALLKEDIVSVSINYRLGALGFLNLGHEVASGNQGLKDLVAALKWIKENIKSFGGDENNITVYGTDTGSNSAHLLMLSPLSKGLFHKAILQGGTAACPWAIRNQLEAYSFRLASVLGNDSKNPEEVVKFLQTIPTARIVRAQHQVLAPEDTCIANFPFGPTIDDKAIRSFLPCPLSELIDGDNNIPIVVGYASHLWLLRDTSERELNRIYTDLPRYVSYFINSQNPQKVRQVTERCKHLYFNNSQEVTKEDIPSIIQCLSDLKSNIPIDYFVEKRRKKKQALTYFFRVNYIGNQLTEVITLNKSTAPGASQSDYITGDRESSRVDTEDQLIQRRELIEKTRKMGRKIFKILATMFFNFIKTGNPTPVLDQHVTTTWLPATEDSFNYLDFNDPIQLLTFTNYDNVMKGLEL